MNPDTTVFIPVPISKKPEKDGSYWVLKSDDHPLDQFRSTETFECGSWNFSGEKVVAWLKPTTISEITTSQPVKTNDDILVKALEEVQHHLDTWPDEPSRAIRLVGKCVATALSSYRTSVKIEDQQENWEEAWDKVSDYIDDDISSLERVAGTNVARHSDFMMLMNDYTIIKKPKSVNNH